MAGLKASLTDMQHRTLALAALAGIVDLSQISRPSGVRELSPEDASDPLPLPLPFLPLPLPLPFLPLPFLPLPFLPLPFLPLPFLPLPFLPLPFLPYHDSHSDPHPEGEGVRLRSTARIREWES